MKYLLTVPLTNAITSGIKVWTFRYTNLQTVASSPSLGALYSQVPPAGSSLRSLVEGLYRCFFYNFAYSLLHQCSPVWTYPQLGMSTMHLLPYPMSKLLALPLLMYFWLGLTLTWLHTTLIHLLLCLCLGRWHATAPPPRCSQDRLHAAPTHFHHMLPYGGCTLHSGTTCHASPRAARSSHSWTSYWRWRKASCTFCMAFPGGSEVKNPPAMQEIRVLSLSWEDPPQ